MARQGTNRHRQTHQEFEEDLRDKNSLKEMCEKYGIEYREGVTRLHDVAKITGVGYQDGDSVELVRSRVETSGYGSNKAKEVEDDPKPLEDFTVAQLRGIALDEDINIEGLTKKDDIIEEIRKHL